MVFVTKEVAVVYWFATHLLQGLFGKLFIKFNIMWCRYRKFSSLGNYPILEVRVCVCRWVGVRVGWWVDGYVSGCGCCWCFRVYSDLQQCASKCMRCTHAYWLCCLDVNHNEFFLLCCWVNVTVDLSWSGLVTNTCIYHYFVMHFRYWWSHSSQPFWATPTHTPGRFCVLDA